VTRVAGVDGCRGGWVVASGEAARAGDGVALAGVRIEVVERFADVLAMSPRPERIAVDIPIGLPDEGAPGGRTVDREARRLLGPRRTSVFSPPVRAVLACPDYREALRVMRASSAHGVGLTKQCWNIVPKIREVDEALRADAAARERVVEAHPELSFRAMAGGLMADRKATGAGVRERADALAAAGVELDPEVRLAGAKADDMLDACACLWTAARVALGVAERIPVGEERDGEGLAMEISPMSRRITQRAMSPSPLSPAILTKTAMWISVTIRRTWLRCRRVWP